MKTWTSLVAASLVAATLVAPAWARTVKIETAIALADHSEETLNRAVRQAVEASVKGAAAMGLSWIRLDGAQVIEDALVVAMIASDEDLDDEDDEPAAAAPVTL